MGPQIAPSSKKDTVFSEILLKERRGRNVLAFQVSLVAFAILFSFWVTGMFDGDRLSEGFPAIGVLISEMMPPDFTRWRQWIQPMFETIAMSVAGTTLAIAFSVPIAILAAKNTTPNRWVYSIARMALNGFRAIPELIMGIIFVAAVGFGMLPGVLALGLHSIGMVGKFFAEAIEHARPAPIEAAGCWCVTTSSDCTWCATPSLYAVCGCHNVSMGI